MRPRNAITARRVGARGLAVIALAMLTVGCHRSGPSAGGVTAAEDRQLDQAAADLDANAAESNAVNPSDGEQSQ